MRVLVTGGAGRLGRSVVRELQGLEHEVVSADRVVAAGLPVRQITVDLTDEEATRRLMGEVAPDAVIHLAAIAVPFSAPESVILRTNTALVLSVLQAAAQAGVERVLAASSPTVMGYGAPHGWVAERLPLTEDQTPRPWHAYGLSKLVIEEAVAMFARSHPSTVFGAFRPCYVITPEEWAGEPTQQGHTVLERLADPALAAVSLFNYVDARDVGLFIDTWLRRADSAASGEVFFVGAADALVRQDIGLALAEHLPALAPAAALASTAGRLGPTESVFSSAKAARLLGWRPTRTWRAELAAADDKELTVS